MIINKKEHFLKINLTKSIGKPKDPWKGLRSLELPSKTSSYKVNALKVKNTVEHDVNSVFEDFGNYYSTLAENFVKMFPKPTNKYSIQAVIKYYEHMILGDYFHLASVSENSVLYSKQLKFQRQLELTIYLDVL